MASYGDTSIILTFMAMSVVVRYITKSLLEDTQGMLTFVIIKRPFYRCNNKMVAVIAHGFLRLYLLIQDRDCHRPW